MTARAEGEVKWGTVSSTADPTATWAKLTPAQRRLLYRCVGEHPERARVHGGEWQSVKVLLKLGYLGPDTSFTYASITDAGRAALKRSP